MTIDTLIESDEECEASFTFSMMLYRLLSGSFFELKNLNCGLALSVLSFLL